MTITKTPFPIKTAKAFEPGELSLSIDIETLAEAEAIVDAVRTGGEASIRHYARQFNERSDEQPLLIGRDEMEAAAKRIDHADVELIRRGCSSDW